jgi:hypothetical protein
MLQRLRLNHGYFGARASESLNRIEPTISLLDERHDKTVTAGGGGCFDGCGGPRTFAAALMEEISSCEFRRKRPALPLPAATNGTIC